MVCCVAAGLHFAGSISKVGATVYLTRLLANIVRYSVQTMPKVLPSCDPSRPLSAVVGYPECLPTEGGKFLPYLSALRQYVQPLCASLPALEMSAKHIP